jgi:hypothetical protein
MQNKAHTNLNFIGIKIPKTSRVHNIEIEMILTRKQKYYPGEYIIYTVF